MSPVVRGPELGLERDRLRARTIGPTSAWAFDPGHGIRMQVETATRLLDAA